MNSRLLSAAECADLLALNLSTIYALVHQQRIPHVKLGRALRFRPEDIERWVQSQAKEARDVRAECTLVN
jgi:excisionase family DNA binding protein